MMCASRMMLPAAMMCPAGHDKGKHRIIATIGSGIISERKRRSIIRRTAPTSLKKQWFCAIMIPEEAVP